MMRLASQPFPSGVSRVASESASANKQGPRGGLCASSLASCHIICLVWTNQACTPIDPTALFDKKIIENTGKFIQDVSKLTMRRWKMPHWCLCWCDKEDNSVFDAKHRGSVSRWNRCLLI